MQPTPNLETAKGGRVALSSLLGLLDDFRYVMENAKKPLQGVQHYSGFSCFNETKEDREFGEAYLRLPSVLRKLACYLARA